VVAGGRREHEANIDCGGVSQTETENRKKDVAQFQEENANEADGA
jgi:coenzyme F420-reducing hydrogenase alpha subunit